MLNATTSNQEKVAVIQVTIKSKASIDNIIVDIKLLKILKIITEIMPLLFTSNSVF